MDRSTYGSITFQQAFWQTLHLGFVPEKEGLAVTVTDVVLKFLDYAHRSNIQLSLHKRLFFMTSNGYIGLGSVNAREGDSVVVFDRGEMPFILRQSSVVKGVSSWILISDCYVEGWMGGSYFGHKVMNTYGKESANSGMEAEGVIFGEDFVIC
jgi:hypothetical protein